MIGKLDQDGTSIKGVESVIWTYSGCNIPVFGGATCESKRPGVGHIVTNSLEGILGYISKAKEEVGLELHPKVTKVPSPNTNAVGEPLTLSG